MRRRRWPVILLLTVLLLGATGWWGKGFVLLHQRPDLPLPWRSVPVTAPAQLPQPTGGHTFSDAADLRHQDLRAFSLTDWQKLLSTSVMWDTATRWPEPLPAGFDPARVLELGKDPGLGVRSLHAQGITGKGVRVAFLDRPVALGHQEFGPNVHFVQVGYPAITEMHGEATASLLAGKTVGVAPEADLTFYGVQWSLNTLNPMAEILEEILARNRTLPPEERIRAVGTSQGIMRSKPGYDRLMKAIKQAGDEGIFVLWTDSRDYSIWGLDRDPLGNPDDLNAYGPGIWTRGDFYQGAPWLHGVWVPMDARTPAAETGPSDYRFDREGGASWTMPWVVGLYALAAQVKPAITPAEFYRLLQETGSYRTFTHEGREYRLGPIANPPALMERLRQG